MLARNAIERIIPILKKDCRRALRLKVKGFPKAYYAAFVLRDAEWFNTWAGSGSVVDILLVEKARTSVIAEKVRILSAERSVAPVEGQSSPTVPSTVTMLVTQEQCLAINTAIPMGKIAFALRSTRDEESWSDTEFNSNELMTKQVFTEQKPGSINGVVSFTGEENKSFALTDGKWVKTEVMPEGFFVAGR